MMPVIPLLLSVLVGGSQALACEESATTADMLLFIEEAEAAYIALDVEGVRDRLAALDALTPCLSEAIPRTDAARYHRIQGLGAFIRRDGDAASQAFLAARSIQPDASLPSSLVPAGHPVQLLYTSLSLEEQTFGNLPEPAGSYLLLDGRQESRRPLSHPIIFQRIADTGTVQETAYLWPTDELPAFAVAPPMPVPPMTSTITEPVTEPIPPTEAPRGRGVVVVGTGVTAAATGALLVLNRGRQAHYYSDSITLGELGSAQQKVNRSGLATLGAAALTVAGGAALIVVW